MLWTQCTIRDEQSCNSKCLQNFKFRVKVTIELKTFYFRWQLNEFPDDDAVCRHIILL